MEISKGPYARTVQGADPQNIAGTLTTRSVTEKVSAVLMRFPTKVIARASGSSKRAAENARQGDNSMSLTYFLRACREIPELRALAMELMGCETTVDPEFVRGIAMLQNAFVRQQAQKGGE